MEAPKTAVSITLNLERRLAAPPDRVFAAWTQAAALSRWFAPSPDHTAHVDVLDVRVGGRFRIEMRHSGGNVHTVGGEFREIDPPRRLAFTWQWEAAPGGGETLVTVRIEPDGAGSRLVLLHERFASEAERDEHNKGWTGCLDRLPGAIAAAAQ